MFGFTNDWVHMRVRPRRSGVDQHKQRTSQDLWQHGIDPKSYRLHSNRLAGTFPVMGGGVECAPRRGIDSSGDGDLMVLLEASDCACGLWSELRIDDDER